VALQINDQVVRLNPESTRFLQPETRSDNSLTMRVAAREAASWAPIFSTVMEAQENRRTTLFIIEEDGEIRFRRISEAISSPAAEPTARED